MLCRYCINNKLIVAVLLLVVWIFTEVQDLTVTVATQTVEIKALNIAVANGVDDRYRARDADRDLKVVNDRIDEMKEHIEKLDNRYGLDP